jgi:hypothetical protein
MRYDPDANPAPYLNRLACERDAQRYEEAPLTEQELRLADDERGREATPAW